MSASDSVTVILKLERRWWMPFALNLLCWAVSVTKPISWSLARKVGNAGASLLARYGMRYTVK